MERGPKADGKRLNDWPRLHQWPTRQPLSRHPNPRLSLHNILHRMQSFFQEVQIFPDFFLTRWYAVSIFL